MAQTLETIEKRKSTRGFKPDQIPAAALDAILAAGQASPVGMAAFDSLQFTVVQDAEFLKKISFAATKGSPREGSDIYYGAPTVIIVSSTEGPFPGIELANVGGIIQNFLLAATDLDLGSVHVFGTVGAFAAEPELLKEAGIPEGFKVISSAAIGYAKDEVAIEPKVPRNIPVNRI